MPPLYVTENRGFHCYLNPESLTAVVESGFDRAPEGAVMHAESRIGESLKVEFGRAASGAPAVFAAGKHRFSDSSLAPLHSSIRKTNPTDTATRA
jgi:hypothetical protein